MTTAAYWMVDVTVGQPSKGLGRNSQRSGGSFGSSRVRAERTLLTLVSWPGGAKHPWGSYSVILN